MKDLKQKTDKELVKALEDTREKLRAIRFNAAGARTKNVKEQSSLRKVAARILTELNAR